MGCRRIIGGVSADLGIDELGSDDVRIHNHGKVSSGGCVQRGKAS